MSFICIGFTFPRRTSIRIWLVLVSLLSGLFPAQNTGAKMPAEEYKDIIAFASDFSNNDTSIVDRVRQMAADPPTDIESIGFYGAEDYPPRHRLFLATVSLLDNNQKLYSVEDKYTAEIFSIWQDDGIIDEKTLPAAAKAVFGPLITGVEPPGGVQQYHGLVWEKYDEATKELEKALADNGRVLLSIDATDGDTMLFALVSPEIADRWRDKALSEHQGYYSGARSPMWDRFWLYLNYSTRGMMAAEDRKGIPPGTSERPDAIPFAK